MAALGADVLGMSHQGNVTIVELQSTAGTFYKGAMVFYDADGTVINGTNAAIAATDIFAGIVAKSKTTVAGDLMLEVAIDGVWQFVNGQIVLADAGDLAYMAAGTSDNPDDIDVEADVAAGPCVGRVLWSDGTVTKLDISSRNANVFSVT